MKGFVLGVLCTVLVGGFFFHIQSRYDTVNPCTAVERGLAAAVNASIEDEVRAKTGSDVVGQVAKAVLKPVADPVIAAEIKKQTEDRNWFECGYDIIKLDFLGHKAARVAEIKKRLSIP